MHSVVCLSAVTQRCSYARCELCVRSPKRVSAGGQECTAPEPCKVCMRDSIMFLVSYKPVALRKSRDKLIERANDAY